MFKQRKKFLMLGAFIFSVAIALPALAASQRFGGGQPPQGGTKMNGGDFTIPAAAITACESSSEKATCSFTSTGSDGTSKTIEGTCIKNPKDTSVLACMPTAKGNDEKRQEPKEMGSLTIPTAAIAACSSAAENATCSFASTGSDGTSKTIDGTCIKNPKDTSTLFCASSIKDKKDTSEKVEAMKARKATEISNIESRVEKIITFLDSENIDTAEITANLETFKTKAEALLSAFDTYISALKTDESSTSDATKLAVSDARAKLKTAKDVLKDFYVATLRTSINNAIEKISE
jgi:hypothetical protein